MKLLDKPILLSAALAIGLVCASALSPNSGIRRAHRLTEEIEGYRQRNEELALKNRALTLEIEALSGNAKALERAAREDLGLVRPDEIIFNFEP